MVLAAWDAGLVEHRQWETAMDWLAAVAPCGPPLAEALPVLAEPGRPVIAVCSTPSIPAAVGVTPILPAEDLADAPGAYAGLVYTGDGTVQAW
jgi:hypothetical protein